MKDAFKNKNFGNSSFEFDKIKIKKSPPIWTLKYYCIN